MGLAEAAALAEGGVAEIVRLDAEAGGNMVADEAQPGELIGGEGDRRLGFGLQPVVEAFLHGLRKGFEQGLLLEREADEGHEVGKAASLGAALDFGRGGGGKGIPQAVFRPGGVGGAEFLFQFLEHGLGEALAVGAAVENLQGGDFGAVGFDILAEGAEGGEGFFFGGGVEALVGDGVGGGGVDGLLGDLFELDEGGAQGGLVERGAGGEDELLLRGGKLSWRDFLGRGGGPTGGFFRNHIGIE